MTNKRFYIGLSASLHDPAIAIVNPQGEVVFAEATERYLQDKRAFNSPPDNLIRTPDLIKEYCDQNAELILAISWSQPIIFLTKFMSEVSRLFSNFDSVNDLFKKLNWPWPAFQSVITGQASNMTLAGNSILGNPELKNKTQVKYYEHHLTHAAIACYSSPFNEAVCAIIDAYGGWGSYDFYQYKNGKIQNFKNPFLEGFGNGSMGHFYAIICGLCGFDVVKGEEWKVMGLAPYGQYDQNLYQLLQPLIQVKGIDLYVNINEYFPSLEKLQGMIRKPDSSPLEAANLAYTGQLIFMETMEKLLNNLYNRGISQNLVYGGGCALNSTFNGQILQKTQFQNLHIPFAPADDGNALGAALLAYHEDYPQVKPSPKILSPYLGSKISTKTLDNLVKFGSLKNLQYFPGAICKKAAALLAEGKIIGWMQGKAEFGPRALGNRSILTDPRPHDMMDKINSRIKFRERFRPLAPSILHEFGNEYFEDYQESPYMDKTLKFKHAVLHKVPAVVHINETGRLQTVKKEWSEKYYNLINEFYQLTGIPLILNTSFNIMGKPIIHSVEDAIAVFYTTGLDVLVIEDYLIEK
ncbi:MAG: carbamoyltransferase C-terminal domain-containing protein [Nostoc sp.]|uniref:carbamoyltransferase family protein n=1 Tax=Nostoc sp. TaxID=1180 RepID=UPI002FF4477E